MPRDALAQEGHLHIKSQTSYQTYYVLICIVTLPMRDCSRYIGGSCTVETFEEQGNEQRVVDDRDSDKEESEERRDDDIMREMVTKMKTKKRMMMTSMRFSGMEVIGWQRLVKVVNK